MKAMLVAISAILLAWLYVVVTGRIAARRRKALEKSRGVEPI